MVIFSTINTTKEEREATNIHSKKLVHSTTIEQVSSLAVQFWCLDKSSLLTSMEAGPCLDQKDNDDDEGNVQFSTYKEHDQSFEEKSLTVSGEDRYLSLYTLLEDTVIFFSLLESVLSTMAALSSHFSSHMSVVNGVDWSDRTHPTSHCWFPYKFDNLLTVQQCAYQSCTNRNAMRHSLVVQCEVCALIIHAFHLNHSHMNNDDNSISPCRPSFVNDECNSSNYDQHFWSYVSVLPTPCVHCNKRKSMPRNLLNRRIVRSSMMPPSNSNTNRSQSSTGIICLWCSRAYHPWCWEHFTTEDGDTKCDYGIFQ